MSEKIIKIPVEGENNMVTCNLCGSGIPDLKKPVYIRVSMGYNVFIHDTICDHCATTKLNILLEKINFSRCLQKFKSCNKIRGKDLGLWDKETVIVFVKYLKQENLEIKNYGIDITTNYNENRKSFDLMDLIKHRKIDLEKEEEIEKEVKEDKK